MSIEAKRHIEYASGYLDLKMYEDALQEAEAALHIQPDQPQALAIKSSVLWEMKRLPEVEPCMARLAELNPKDAGIWINLAYVRRRTQSLAAAVDTLQRAFDANPKDALAHFNMACYRAVQNRPGEALALLKNALHLDPKLKSVARNEPDFTALRESPEFHQLVDGDTRSR